MSDTKVDEPHIRALLGTASHFYEVVVLKSNGKAGLGGSGAGEVDRGRGAHVARRGREPPHRPVKTLQEYLAHKKQRPLKTLQ